MIESKIEFESVENIASFENQQLKELLAYLKEKSPFYQRIFIENNIDINSIKTVKDLHHIPITYKEDLQKYNADFLCVSPNKIIDYVTTSGTLSEPVTFALSENDLERLAYNEAISFICADANENDIFQLMTTIDKRFMAGLAYFLGIRKLGAGIVRVGNGAPQLQWDSVARIKPTVIVCVPSFILKIIEYAEQNHIDYKNSSIKKAICIGESIKNQDFTFNLLGQKIKEKWDIELFSTYASTEMSTTFTECTMGVGGHHHPELILTEIVDNKGNVLPDGEYGELVISTFGVEAMPLLRFNTGDIAKFYHEPCACGRTTKRISPILGRANQMIKYKGTTIYPAVIYDILAQNANILNFIIEVNSDEVGNDDLIINIATRSEPTEIIAKLKETFRAKLRVTPKIIIKELNEILIFQDVENNRKPTKFIDNRKAH